MTDGQRDNILIELAEKVGKIHGHIFNGLTEAVMENSRILKEMSDPEYWEKRCPLKNYIDVTNTADKLARKQHRQKIILTGIGVGTPILILLLSVFSVF